MNIGKFVQKLAFITSFPSWCDCSRKKRQHKYKNKLTHDVYSRYTRSHPPSIVRVKCWQLVFRQMTRPFTQSRRKGCVPTFASVTPLDIFFKENLGHPPVVFVVFYGQTSPEQRHRTTRNCREPKKLRPKKLWTSANSLVLEDFLPSTGFGIII